MGKSPIKELKNVIRDVFNFIEGNMSGVILIWSKMLPRQWGNEGLKSALKRMNIYAAKLIKQRGGFYNTLICRLLIGFNMTQTGSICHHQVIHRALKTLSKRWFNY